MIQGTIFQNKRHNYKNYNNNDNYLNMNNSPNTPNTCADSLDNLSPSELKAMIVSINSKYKEKDRQAKEFQQF